MRRTLALVLAVVAVGAAASLTSLHPGTHRSFGRFVAATTLCLRTRGWSVKDVSAGHFVATRGPYRLTWDSGKTAFRWRPGWKHTRLIAKAAQTGFTCFPTFPLPL